ncbi:MAG: hypothetical protein RL397_202 [Pseudomonadota bacterium]|jgi:hypothetical protein
MDIKDILVVLYIVICLFWLANWYNRPRDKR